MISSASVTDVAQICTIYNHYIDTSVISFETVAVTQTEMKERMMHSERRRLPWLVAKNGDTVLGYAYATQWKTRQAYCNSVEISVYLAPETHAKGVGSALYQALFEKLKALDIHAVLACIALPNAQSVALHEKFGMRKVAHFEQVGFKFDRWLDVGYWQVNLK